jgi:hypothetical protein
MIDVLPTPQSPRKTILNFSIYLCGKLNRCSDSQRGEKIDVAGTRVGSKTKGNEINSKTSMSLGLWPNSA